MKFVVSLLEEPHFLNGPKDVPETKSVENKLKVVINLKTRMRKFRTDDVLNVFSSKTISFFESFWKKISTLYN